MYILNSNPDKHSITKAKHTEHSCTQLLAIHEPDIVNEVIIILWYQLTLFVHVLYSMCVCTYCVNSCTP